MAKKKSHSNHHSKTENDETLNLDQNQNHPPPQSEHPAVLAMAEQPQQPHRPPPPQPPARTSSLDVEFQKLQSLNKILVQDVADKRRKMEALETEKEQLAAEVKKLGSAAEGSIRSEIEREVAFTVLGEMEEIERLTAEVEDGKVKLSKVCTEKDAIKSQLDEQILEGERLKVIVKVMEKKGKENEDEILGLTKEIDYLVKEKKDSEIEIDRIERIRVSNERSLAEKAEEIGALKVEIERIEKERSDQVFKIEFLEKDFEGLNTDLLSLRSENGGLSEKVVYLEKVCGEAIEKEKAFGMKFDTLTEEMIRNSKRIEELTEEKSSLVKTIESVNTEVELKNELIQKLSSEKSDIERISKRKESEIMELQSNVSELNESVLRLKDSLKVQEEKNSELGIESSKFRDELQQMRIEKEELKKLLVQETNEGSKLKALVQQMEKMIEEGVQKLEKAKIEQKNLMEVKKSLEFELNQLKEESSATQKRLSDQNGHLTSKLRMVASLLPQDDDSSSNGNGKELEELVENVRGSFREKEALLVKKNLQVTSLEESVAEAEKKKGIWAMVSSITTLFAAASLAFAFKVR